MKREPGDLFFVALRPDQRISVAVYTADGQRVIAPLRGPDDIGVHPVIRLRGKSALIFVSNFPEGHPTDVLMYSCEANVIVRMSDRYISESR